MKLREITAAATEIVAPLGLPFDTGLKVRDAIVALAMTARARRMNFSDEERKRRSESMINLNAVRWASKREAE
jgi:hypothetical protein